MLRALTAARPDRASGLSPARGRLHGIEGKSDWQIGTHPRLSAKAVYYHTENVKRNSASQRDAGGGGRYSRESCSLLRHSRLSVVIPLSFASHNSAVCYGYAKNGWW